MANYAGIDWASEAHAVCVIGERGEVLERFDVEHSREGLAVLLRRLARHDGVAVAIERPDGLLIDTLLEAGITVVPIHPNAAKAARPRYSAAGAKSDPADARLLADLLRTDGHRFRALRPQSDRTRALRALVRTRDDLLQAKLALVQQLEAQLAAFWPGAGAIFARLDSAIALAFLERYPTPESAAHLGERRLAAFLRRNAYCGRRPAGELLARLERAPRGRVAAAESEARGECVRALVRAIAALLRQLDELEGALAVALEEHPDGAIIKSFPRAGVINAAQILAELGDVRPRYPTDDALAAEAGAAPVTRRSGKVISVGFRWACNKRLRRAITGWADNSRRGSPWAEAIYRRARDRGADHPHAVRILARAWIRVLWRCWTDGVAYDAARHAAAAAIATAA